MSNAASATAPSPIAGQEAAPLDWLLALLKEAMVGVMADDTPASKKANALARLGSLYLKADNAVELKRVNAELVERVAELEKRVAELEERPTAAGSEAAAEGENGTVRTAPADEAGPATLTSPQGTHMNPRSHGRKHPARNPHGRPKAKRGR